MENLDYSEKDNSRESNVVVMLRNGNRIAITGETQLPDTNLSVLIKAVAAQVIFDCGRDKVAPNEIWKAVEKAWAKAKASVNEYKIVNSHQQSGRM